MIVFHKNVLQNDTLIEEEGFNRHLAKNKYFCNLIPTDSSTLFLDQVLLC